MARPHPYPLVSDTLDTLDRSRGRWIAGTCSHFVAFFARDSEAPPAPSQLVACELDHDFVLTTFLLVTLRNDAATTAAFWNNAKCESTTCCSTSRTSLTIDCNRSSTAAHLLTRGHVDHLLPMARQLDDRFRGQQSITLNLTSAHCSSPSLTRTTSIRSSRTPTDDLRQQHAN